MRTVKWKLNINNNPDVRLAWCQLWLQHSSISEKTFCFLLDLIGPVIQWSIRVRPGRWANASSLCSAVLQCISYFSCYSVESDVIRTLNTSGLCYCTEHQLTGYDGIKNQDLALV